MSLWRDLNSNIELGVRGKALVLCGLIIVLLVSQFFDHQRRKGERMERALRQARTASGPTATATATGTPGSFPDSSTEQDRLSQLFSQARGAYQDGSFKKAREDGKAALDLATDLKDEEKRLDCLELLAEVALARGRTDAALEYYRSLTPVRLNAVFQHQVEELEQALATGSRGRMDAQAKLVCELAEGRTPLDSAVMKRALAATEKAKLPSYTARLKRADS